MAADALIRVLQRTGPKTVCAVIRKRLEIMRSIALLLIVLLLAPTTVAAEGWSLKNLWPGDSESTTSSSKTAMMNGRPMVGSPYQHTTSKKKSDDGPSVFTRVGDGTKSFFSKTVDVLTLSSLREDSEDNSTSSFPSWQQNSSNSGSRWSKKKEVEEEPGWFGSLFKREEAPHPSRTMSDFLSQDRPDGGL